jgi:hypothetical protein
MPHRSSSVKFDAFSTKCTCAKSAKCTDRVSVSGPDSSSCDCESCRWRLVGLRKDDESDDVGDDGSAVVLLLVVESRGTLLTNIFLFIDERVGRMNIILSSCVFSCIDI